MKFVGTLTFTTKNWMAFPIFLQNHEISKKKAFIWKFDLIFPEKRQNGSMWESSSVKIRGLFYWQKNEERHVTYFHLVTEADFNHFCKKWIWKTHYKVLMQFEDLWGHLNVIRSIPCSDCNSTHIKTGRSYNNRIRDHGGVFNNQNIRSCSHDQNRPFP